MPPTATSLALQIARLIRSENLAPGEPLSERGLATRFHVSRSPVRVAVQELVRLGILAPQPRGGHCVADPQAAAALADCPPAPDADEEVYLAIARDRLAALVPDRISENELLRRYGITRPRLQALLRRMSGEGWVERLPGNGWRFLPVLTSMESYRQSYGFRQAIEPAALLDPGFRCNPPVLLRHLDQQRALVGGEIHRLSAVRLFEINSAMHEAIAECSGNAFFIESLKRVNRLRRLMEYGLAIDRDQSIVRCREHVRILELVLEGRTPEASALMGEHLARLGPLKTGDRTSQ